MATKERKSSSTDVDTLAFTKTNLVLFAIGLAVIIIGWLLLGKGSISLAPVLLVIGYCILIPLALVWGLWKKDKNENS
jgi:ABC-type uncharacterized transport system permease subunit